MMRNQTTQTIQPPAVAGLFYPEQADTLRHDVDQFLLQARSEALQKDHTEHPVKALIVPHAGYVYSGAIAARAYAQLIPDAGRINRVVVFAPAHRMAFNGMAVSSADVFNTPLGDIPLDDTCRQQLVRANPSLHVLDQAFNQEHAVEVQLPFLQRLLGDFQLLPILVGRVEPAEVQKVLNQCWGGPQTLIVISSDLSHFHDYQTAVQMDQHTTAAIESLNADEVAYGDACGRTAINGLLLTAGEKGLKAKTVALGNSGDTGAGRESVVGYGAYVFR